MHNVILPDNCTQKFLNNMFIQRPQIVTVPKKELKIIYCIYAKCLKLLKVG